MYIKFSLKRALLCVSFLFVQCFVPSTAHARLAENGSSTQMAAEYIDRWPQVYSVQGMASRVYSATTDSAGNIFMGGYSEAYINDGFRGYVRESFLVKYNSSGNMQWVRKLRWPGRNIIISSVATDREGNIFAVGYADVGFDGSFLTGRVDFFLTKYDTNGIKQWTQELGAPRARTFANSVATDAQGNIFVGGYTEGALDGNSLNGLGDAFITKYSNRGIKQWTRQLGMAKERIYGRSVATDLSGNAFLGGFTPSDLDGNSLVGTSDFFLAKYDSNGLRQWTKLYGRPEVASEGYSVATDGLGNTYMVGYYNRSENKSDLYNLLLVKFDSSGSTIWDRELGAEGKMTAGLGIAVRGSKDIYVTGITNGSLDGNEQEGVQDSFLVKYDDSGNKQWARQFGSKWYSYSSAVTLDSLGNIFVAGFTGYVFGGLTIAPYMNAFLVKFDPSGLRQ